MSVSTRRSVTPSNTSENSYCSRYRSPPWTSLVDREDVPDARSPISTSATLSPRRAASRATPQPVMPPPMTSRS